MTIAQHFRIPQENIFKAGLLIRSRTSMNLTGIAVAALVASPTMMVLAIIAPQLAWMLGIILILLGAATVIKAFMDWGDAEEYVVGIIVAVFGFLTEVADIQGLAYMTVFAIFVDFFFGMMQRYS